MLGCLISENIFFEGWSQSEKLSEIKPPLQGKYLPEIASSGKITWQSPFTGFKMGRTLKFLVLPPHNISLLPRLRIDPFVAYSSAASSIVKSSFSL